MPSNNLTVEQLNKLIEDAEYEHEAYVICEDRTEAKRVKKVLKVLRAELATRIAAK